MIRGSYKIRELNQSYIEYYGSKSGSTMVLNQGCLWYLIMVKWCTYSVSRYFSWYQIMVALKISLFLIKVGWKSMVPNQCFKKVYGYYSVLRSGEKSVLWKILWLLIMATMVPDQCCHKINCTYSYMGLNHGTPRN